MSKLSLGGERLFGNFQITLHNLIFAPSDKEQVMQKSSYILDYLYVAGWK